MLNTHQNNPHWAIPINRQAEVTLSNEPIYDLSCLIAIRFNLLRSWPNIIVFIKVIPRHLINTNRKRGLDVWINPNVNPVCHIKLINVEDCGVAVVKNQRVSQRIGTCIKRIIVRQTFKNTLVQRKRIVKILENFLSFCFDISFIENGSSGYQRRGIISTFHEFAKFN